MNHINAFYNSKFTIRGESGAGNALVSIGDFCLKPVRQLFKGEKLCMNKGNSSNEISLDLILKEPANRTFIGKVLTIAFLAPGIILGTVFKSLGYLCSTIREKHRIAALHNITKDSITVGSNEKRLNVNEISKKLSQLALENDYYQRAKAVIIYAEKGTEIVDDPGILQWNPDKIILVGARVIHESGIDLRGPLDRQLGEGWETKPMIQSKVKIQHIPNESGLREAVDFQGGDSYAIQYTANSVKSALEDVPPVYSWTSFSRYKRIYLVD